MQQTICWDEAGEVLQIFDTAALTSRVLALRIARQNNYDSFARQMRVRSNRLY